MDSMPGPFTTQQVAKLVGVSSRIVTSWVERSYLLPSIRQGTGRGVARMWSYLDLVRALAVKQLLIYFQGDALRSLAPWLSQDANIGSEDAWFLCADASGAIQMIPGLGEASPFDLPDKPADLPAIMSRLGETLRVQADHADGERFAPRPVGVVVCFGLLHELVRAWVKAEQAAATYESAWRAVREREERVRLEREERDRAEWKEETTAAALDLRNQEVETNGH